MSLFNATTTVETLTAIPKHISRAQVLSFLHDDEKMIRMNPIVTSVKRLPDAASIAFYKSEPAANQPAPPAGQGEGTDGGPIILPVYEVVEDSSVEPPEAAAGNWRGGWAKRFIPEKIQYETSVEVRADGLRSLTHAAMGVTSVTHWIVREVQAADREAHAEKLGDWDGLVVEKIGSVTSNRMLMGFIRTTLEESHAKLAADFVAALEKEFPESAEGKSA